VKALAPREEKFITNHNGKRVGVLLDLKAYQRLREAEEELQDIQAYDAARPQVTRELASGQFATLSKYRASRGRKRK